MNRQNLFWGLALLVLGILLLADNLGLLGGVNVWAIFWPLALIALGVRVLWRSTGSRAGTLQPVPPAAGGDAAMPAAPVNNRVSREAVRLPLQAARQATLRFHHGAGELRVDGNAAPDELLSGTFDGGLERQISGGQEDVSVDLRVPSGVFADFIDGGLNWTVGLNPNIPLALEMELGASKNWLDLHDLQVKSLRLQTGASATVLTLPARAGEVHGVIRSGAASVEIRVPENVSARIHVSGGLASHQVDLARFPRLGGEHAGDYASPDYEMAANKVDLDIETGLGSVSVR